MGTFNYRRGLQRVYSVLVVVWIAVALTLVIAERSQTDIFDVAASGRSTTDLQIRYWSQGLAAVFLPPVFGYFALFVVIPWIARGFRNE